MGLDVFGACVRRHSLLAEKLLTAGANFIIFAGLSGFFICSVGLQGMAIIYI
jgi:hypothetical protein